MPEGKGYGIQDTFTTIKGLNVVGNHAYAYSGEQTTTTTAKDQIVFTTGNYYFLADIYFNGGVQEGTATGAISTCQTTLNGISVSLMRVNSTADDQPSTQNNIILIPPFTECICSVDSTSTETAQTSVAITGRIYK